MEKHTEKEKMLEQILDREWQMFSNVKTSENSPCQEQPQTFRVMRWMSHSVHTTEVLQSYLKDLNQAHTNGRNLMTEKYALMGNQISHSTDPRTLSKIYKIVATETLWMKDLSVDYPMVFSQQQSNFECYFTCELETLSPRTIELMYHEFLEAEKTNRNLVRERYHNLFQKTGCGSLETMEKNLQLQSGANPNKEDADGH